jgi:ribosomal protein L16 Arg81 hydroxylase
VAAAAPTDAVMTDSLDMRRLLSPVGVELFFAEHWQRRMALLPLAAEDLAFIRETIGPLDPVRLAGAAREGAQAWLANDFVAHSVFPVDPSNAALFQDIGATLYFVNVPLPALTDSLADFLGAPRRKVLASLFFTPASGGAVPHFDKNENFTIQLTGAKRWQVGETPMVPVTPDSYTLGSSAITPALAPLLAQARRPPERTVWNPARCFMCRAAQCITPGRGNRVGRSICPIAHPHGWTCCGWGCRSSWPRHRAGVAP